MSDEFYEELETTTTESHLGVCSVSCGAQTSTLLTRIEEVLITELEITFIKL